jgi:hypothetical protein
VHSRRQISLAFFSTQQYLKANIISSTEREIMSGVIEPNSYIVALYWSILRNMDEYKKDYAELEKDWEGKEMWFADKWSLLEPIDPSQDEVEPLYFFRDKEPFTPAESKGFSESPYARNTLTIELDIRRTQIDLINEIKEIISKEKENALDSKEAINLIGEERPQSKKHYEDLLDIQEKRAEGLSYDEIFRIAVKENIDFKIETVQNHCKKIRKIKKNFPVPIVKK